MALLGDDGQRVWEDVTPHWNWNADQTPTGGSSEEFCAMGVTLTQRRRVGDDGFRVVKPCRVGRMVIVLIS